ncbi:hypothetical protein MSG28_008053 [Choristoneura fumiferana]|uniref:Uncharacterized protein n=1 Tax=Choristoneura fumiferana TaxID=7141 RepID=A0ACC0J9Q3_CHOFU|nr:hypothetical protein MSG28_008053 [Choristoneura fumiferana]
MFRFKVPSIQEDSEDATTLDYFFTPQAMQSLRRPINIVRKLVTTQRRTSLQRLSSSITNLAETPFVRQNTPHPKDLKAKAHKLLAGRSPEAVVQTAELPKVQAPTTNGLPLSPVEAVPTPMEVIEPPHTPAAAVLSKEEESDNEMVPDGHESSEGENDDSDELETGTRRVAWRAGVREPDAAAGAGGRLHRRDTPHHLKNKRVNQMDAGRARDLIAQVHVVQTPHTTRGLPLRQYEIAETTKFFARHSAGVTGWCTRALGRRLARSRWTLRGPCRIDCFASQSRSETCKKIRRLMMKKQPKISPTEFNLTGESSGSARSTGEIVHGCDIILHGRDHTRSSHDHELFVPPVSRLCLISNPALASKNNISQFAARDTQLT